MIDSEQVPWGKGEKHPDEGDEIVSETIRLQGVNAPCFTNVQHEFLIFNFKIIFNDLISKRLVISLRY